MKDYMNLYQTCRDELKRIGIDTSDDITVKITKKASFFGQFIRKDRVDTIEIFREFTKG